ncbi:TPA: oleate hydratase [Staphylococcus aureus]|nr:oleate hydratase [Staphylococcus aureus]
MYYSYGNYEAFARPKKPENVENKSAYLIGSGLASLAAACFLIRDGQMEGSKIHILEELPKAGGSLDGENMPLKGYVVRGGREMENHFECLWDLFRSIPSLEIDNASVLDEFYWLNKEDPNYSRCRVIEKQGQRLVTDGDFTLTKKAIKEILDLCLTNEEDLDDVKITDVFSDDFFNSNFCIYWKTMFAFEPWHSAMEMRRYLMRFVHHIGGLADFSALKFTKYNQYESLVLPMVEYLKSHGVQFEYDVKVEDIKVDVTTSQKIAREILIHRHGKAESIKLTVDDLVFVTNGSITESSTYGDNDTPAPPTDKIEDLAKHASNTIPVYMPYITSYFMTRAIGDRPLVVPHQSQNLAFIGNFAETERDTVFTTEYSVRTAMEAVYQLLNIDRGIPEVINSTFDLRVLMDAVYELNDHQDLREITKDSKIQKLALAGFLKKVKGTYIETLLKEHKLL